MLPAGVNVYERLGEGGVLRGAQLRELSAPGVDLEKRDESCKHTEPKFK